MCLIHRGLLSYPTLEVIVRLDIQQAVCLSRWTRILLTSGLLAFSPDCGLAQPALERQACAVGEAQTAIGQPYSLELAERARRAVGAREVRKIEPGGAYTTDLEPGRLNFEVDRTGIVTGLRCG